MSTPFSTDPNQDLIFVIGDPQGRVDLLNQLVQQICRGNTWPLADNDKIVIMGNFMYEQGANREIIQYIRQLKTMKPDQVIILRGKNEHRVLRERAFSDKFGQDLVNSYRILPVKNVKGFKNTFSLDTLGLYEDLSFIVEHTHKFYETKSFYFVSSGVNFDRPFEDNPVNSVMFYAGQTFENNTKKLDKLLIHGTHPQKGGVFKENRVNVNSEPATSDTLSCYIFDDRRGEFKDRIKVSKKKAA